MALMAWAYSIYMGTNWCPCRNDIKVLFWPYDLDICSNNDLILTLYIVLQVKYWKLFTSKIVLSREDLHHWISFKDGRVDRKDENTKHFVVLKLSYKFHWIFLYILLLKTLLWILPLYYWLEILGFYYT